jgi:hypothetical protein
MGRRGIAPLGSKVVTIRARRPTDSGGGRWRTNLSACAWSPSIGDWEVAELERRLDATDQLAGGARRFEKLEAEIANSWNVVAHMRQVPALESENAGLTSEIAAKEAGTSLG